jgi:RimJ/RimL family protein N-acetyltransferase
MVLILETPRLVLREINPETDAQAMYELNLDPIIKKYTGDDPFESVKTARLFFEKYDHYQIHGFGRWAMVLKETNEIMGWCGLKNHGDFIDLGFRLIPRFRGFGYTTEASIASLGYGFNTLKMTEIVGRTLPHNHASINVLEKIGMEFWKEDKCNGIDNTFYYRINKNQFLNLTTNKK